MLRRLNRDDTSWHQVWTGTERAVTFVIDGNTLTATTPPFKSSLAVAIATAETVESLQAAKSGRRGTCLPMSMPPRQWQYCCEAWACSLSLARLASVIAWRGRRTAGPSHCRRQAGHVDGGEPAFGCPR